MIKKKALKKELKRMVNDLLPEAVGKVVRLASFRRLDLLEQACQELIQMRHDISMYEFILEVPDEEIAFPHNTGWEKI